MLELVTYTIYDTKAEAYQTPFFAPNDAVAIRIFKGEANDERSQIGQNPEDFILFKNGKFSFIDGVLTPTEKTSIANAHELKEQK